MKKNYKIPFILAFFFGCFFHSLAALKTPSQSGNWSAVSTWGGSAVPTAGDDVIITGDMSITVDINNAVCLSMQLGGSVPDQGLGAIIFSAGSQLTVLGLVNIGPVNDKTTEGSLSMANGGKLICEGIITGRLGTWTAGTGTIELTATSTMPTDKNVIFNNLIISGGTTTLSGNLNVNGSLLINTGGTLNGNVNTLFVGGDWVNNGIFSGNAGTVTFMKNGSQTISGTGQNNFNLIRVDMGTTINNVLEVNATSFNAPDGFLNIINGTFKISGTFIFANTFVAGPIYNIDPGTALWINNPNVTVTAQAGNVSLRGLLRLTAGTYNVGNAINHSLVYVTGSSINIEGGTLNIAGRFTRNNATATTLYSQSGGTVAVAGKGSSDATFAAFDLGAAGSVFNMSDGKIIIRNATGAPADYLNASSIANITGGTLQIGDEITTGPQTIRIQSARLIPNLLISGSSLQTVKPTVSLVGLSMNVTGNIIMETGTTLNANGFNITLGGNWINNGTFNSGVNAVTFNGSAGQTITKVPGTEVFNNLVINKLNSTLTINGPVTVNNNFNLTQGEIVIGSNTLNLNGAVVGGGTLTSASDGTINYNQPFNGQNVLGGNYGNLGFSNFTKILPATGTIGIAGTFIAGNATGHTITGSSIDFNGGNQPVPAFVYNKLTLSGSGIKTGAGTITVESDFLNKQNTVFSNTNILNLNGITNLNAGNINASTISIAGGSTLYNTGTTTVNAVLNGAGTFIQDSLSVLNIGGSVNIVVLNAAKTDNMVNYTGITQTVKPVIYHHLALSGSGPTVIAGLNTINGNLTMSGTVSATATVPMIIEGRFNLNPGTAFFTGGFPISIGR